MREKQENLVGKYAFFAAKLIFNHCYANKPKKTQSSEEELVKNAVFSLLVGRLQRVNYAPY